MRWSIKTISELKSNTKTANPHNHLVDLELDYAKMKV